MYTQCGGGLTVEEKTMKVVVALVLVGSSAICTTHSKHRTHTIKRSHTTALSHEQDKPHAHKSHSYSDSVRDRGRRIQRILGGEHKQDMFVCLFVCLFII